MENLPRLPAPRPPNPSIHERPLKYSRVSQRCDAGAHIHVDLCTTCSTPQIQSATSPRRKKLRFSPIALLPSFRTEKFDYKCIRLPINYSDGTADVSSLDTFHFNDISCSLGEMTVYVFGPVDTLKPVRSRPFASSLPAVFTEMRR
ncbi:Hypothetical protein NTJ_01288 [Nesidiocoris tenuis]|uniref:Uncharacterized protein n=1 Tax=Nesidiocoris tenuis TaxID=355587 RepID=A0ABN7A861_9HEMI|nr:Hypothetical protein NTJ_01288 [Nesidiocoris tenuis]